MGDRMLQAGNLMVSVQAPAGAVLDSYRHAFVESCRMSEDLRPVLTSAAALRPS